MARKLDKYEREKQTRAKAQAQKKADITKTRSQVESLLNRALKSKHYTIEEQHESDWCNRRNRRR